MTTNPGNELELNIEAGKKAVALFKINNKTDQAWPSGCVMNNNFTGDTEKFQVQALSTVY